MRVYIPFNSNDFNSVFTTLSISPCSFYPNRKYSFKRSTSTFLNENEDFLVGFENPIFHNREYDNDYGFPILIEIEITIKDWQITANGIKYVIIGTTVFLMNDFKLLFRSEKEMNEIFAKSLKSIETKYTVLAKCNSEIVKSDCFVSEMPLLQFPSVNDNFNSLVFYKERKLNRILGAFLGSSIATTNIVSKEWQEISNLLRLLNNNLSLFINKVVENNDFEKKNVFDIINQILKVHERVEILEEAIMHGSNSSFTSDLLDRLKQSKIFNISVFNLLIEGLLVTSKAELPLSLKLEKLKRAINSKVNSKYPGTYVQRINNSFSDVRSKIEEEISLSRTNNKLSIDALVRPVFLDESIEFIIPEGLLGIEKKYLEESLKYFVENDNIPDVETFFTNRKEILIKLAQHYKDTIDNFFGSKEREYLGELLNSFDSLRGGFDISRISNEVLKSIAVLFTSGRDLFRFIENNEREEVHNCLIYYTLWGSIYGAAILPKTLTESFLEDKTNVNIFISVYADIVCDFQNSKLEDVLVNSIPDINSLSGEKELLSTEEGSIVRDANTVIVSMPKYISPISTLGYQILDLVGIKRQIKLSDLKSLSRQLKTNGDVENLINSQLHDKVKIIKRGMTKYAELICN
jgi:hypothetical protein